MNSKVYIDISNTTCGSQDLLRIVVSGIWSYFINCACIFHKRDRWYVERIACLVVIVCAVGGKGEPTALIFSCLDLLLVAFLPESSILSVKLLILLSNLPSPFTLNLIWLLRLRFAFGRVRRGTLALIFVLGCLLGTALTILFGRNAPVVLLIWLLLLATIPIQTIFEVVCWSIHLAATLRTVQRLFIFVIHLLAAHPILDTSQTSSTLSHRHKVTMAHAIACMTHWTILNERYLLISAALLTRLIEEDLVRFRASSINLILKLRGRRQTVMIRLSLIYWLMLIDLSSRRLHRR